MGWARWALSAALTVGVAAALWGSWADYRASRLSEQAGRDVQAGRLSAAATDLRQALRLRPHDPDVLRQAASVAGTLALFRPGQTWPQQAVSLAQQATVFGQQDARNFAALGWALQDAGQTAQAEIAFLKALRLDPDNQADLYALGLLYENSGRPDAALGQYEKAWHIRRDAVLEAALTRLGARPLGARPFGAGP